MAQLRRRDFQGTLDFLEGLYATTALDAYAARVTRGVLGLVPGEYCSYNEVNPRRRRVSWVVEPVESDFPDSRKIFAAHMHEHPFLGHWRLGSSASAVRLSDFVSRREWHDRALYTDFYRQIEVEHFIGVQLTPSPVEIHVSVLRARSDFVERECLLLNLLRPHLVAAYRNAEAASDGDHELALLRQGAEAGNRTVIMLGEDRRIRQMTPRAQTWLIAYFGPRWTDRTHLPSPLDGWIKRQELGTASASDAAPVRRPLVAERDGRRLTLRLLSEGSRSLLLLTEEKLRLEPGDLAALGLARRETEVLTWVAAGKTNPAIADILGLSPVTVKHCLERVYVKLGVSTRAAAAAIAMRAAGRVH